MKKDELDPLRWLRELTKAIVAGEKTPRGFKQEFGDALIKRVQGCLEHHDRQARIRDRVDEEAALGLTESVKEQIAYAQEHNLHPPEVIPDLVFRCSRCHVMIKRLGECGCIIEEGPKAYAGTAV